MSGFVGGEYVNEINPNRKFAKKMIEERKRQRLSQHNLSELTGLTRGTIAHIELGNQRIFLHQALIISFVLKFDFEFLK